MRQHMNKIVEDIVISVEGFHCFSNCTSTLRSLSTNTAEDKRDKDRDVQG